MHRFSHPSPMVFRAAFAALGLFLSAGQISAAETVDYTRQIKPLLAARCYACHGVLQQKGNLRLDTAELLRKGGDSGPAVVVGRSVESPLIERLTGAGGVDRMPPEGEGEPLKPAEIELIRRWIDSDALSPADERPEPDPRDHWSFRTPVKPAIPTVKDSRWSRNPVDAFIAAEYESRGLKPQGDADPAILLRRVYLDLIGLPPSAEEIESFLSKFPSSHHPIISSSVQDDERAYAILVDKLLASPQYGERWGRHWMDVWRYSDWWGLGAEVRNSQKHIWHWRDWIIESLNDDKGYDQMVREMLAADELYPADLDRLRASGFLARPYFKFNRTSWLDEVIEHTSKGFLGLTFNCAKCHDHKYDPFAQADYYRLRAIFEPYQVRTDQWPGEIDFEKNGLPRVFDCNLEQPTYIHTRGDDTRPQKDKPLAPGLPGFLATGDFEVKPVALPPEAHLPGLRPYVFEDHLRDAREKVVTATKGLEQAKVALSEAEKLVAIAKAAQADKTSNSTKTDEPLTLLKETFQSEVTSRWQPVSGQWAFDGGKCLQKQDGPSQAGLRLKQSAPENFEARLKFTILDGKQYRSVGLSFDADDQNETLVYISGAKSAHVVNVAHKKNGKYEYPGGARRSADVPSLRPLEMVIQVRGETMTVTLNGQQVLSFTQQVPRRPAALQLTTYDAQVEFHEFELRTVTATAASGKPATLESLIHSRDQTAATVIAAERSLTAAELLPATLEARAVADRAAFRTPPTADAKELAKCAARAERQLALAKTAADVAQVELELLKADAAKKADIEKKLATAKTAVETARKGLDDPTDKYTSLRGSVKTPESNLESGASLVKPYPQTSTGRRTALANWLTDPRHPLTARVAVNQIWSRHMGRPLVPTVFDFGRKGQPPTHPQLLDFLAVELMEHGWSMKHIHRLIVTSNTYRLSGSSVGAEPANLKIDPENRYYWRRNAIRMEAQAVRDSMLALAGELDPALGGPSVPVADESSRRRSLYYVHSHNDHQKFLSIFDDANVLECYRRSESIVPQQALAMFNSKLAQTMAGKIADRLAKNSPSTDDDRAYVDHAWQLIVGGNPTNDERQACLVALRDWRELAKTSKPADAASRARVKLVEALLNHNDFVTIR